MSKDLADYYNSDTCLGGSGHGGKGGNHDTSPLAYVGLTYGQGDMQNLIGGSSGEAHTYSSVMFILHWKHVHLQNVSVAGMSGMLGIYEFYSHL